MSSETTTLKTKPVESSALPSVPVDEVEQLIEELGKLSLQDAHYARLYYKAVKLDPTVAGWMTPPQQRRTTFEPSRRFSSNTQGQPTCYGCGKPGHMTRECTELQALLKKGTIIRNSTGQIMFRDGTPVRRQYNETLIQAISNRSSRTSHFYAIQDEDSEDDEYNNYYYLSELDEESDYEVFEAKCIETNIRNA